HGDFTVASGAAAMRDLLDRAPNIDAVFAASDLMAAGAISTLQSRGRRIPIDVAVVGFDNSSAATDGKIGITTVVQPSRQLGAEMARTMLALLRGEPVERARLLPTRMVIRESA
ncbi:MAG: substrate-binding domain-containing protein, partial [Salinibacterium sp.]|nr:substrate-binding domain-containing protein [Salinibacterium sp.]